MREGLANVVRHAHAAAVEVRIVHDGGDLVLSVIDDSVGLFPGDRRSGLANLEARVAAERQAAAAVEENVAATLGGAPSVGPPAGPHPPHENPLPDGIEFV